MAITVQDIYTKCGLEDAEIFMRRKYADNVKTAGMFAAADPMDLTDEQDPHGRLYRQIGATKWMAANAALVVIRGKSVQVVDRSYGNGKTIAKTIREMCWIMTGVNDNSLIHDVMDYKGFTSSSKRIKSGVTVFHDEQWKERAVRRIQGPFAMTREIRYEQGKYVAYAEDNERLMVIAPDGLMDFMAKWPNVVAVGWKFDGLTAAPFGVMPTLPGALSLHMTPTRNMSWVVSGRQQGKTSNFSKSFG